MKTSKILILIAVAGVALLAAGRGFAQSGVGVAAEGAEKLTLRQAVMRAVQNSRDLALARIQYNVAERTAAVNRSDFRPNFFAGSGAAYTNGFPQTPNGGAPSVFNLTYSQALFNPPLRGELRAAEEHRTSQQLEVDRVRDTVIIRTASGYLELAKVRHSLELLRHERESAQKIVDVTRERLASGLELPIELTRAQLSSARVEQRIVRLEGREEALESQLRADMALPAGEPIEVSAEPLPLAAEQSVNDLLQQALANNAALKQAESERRARVYRLKGERGGYFPTLNVVGEYSVFSNVNHFLDFYKKFERHNVTIGVSVQIPIFSAHTTAAVSLAQSELNAAEVTLKNKRSDLEAEVRQKAHRTRELELAREVARLELQLAQQNIAGVQAQFNEGRATLRDLEKARLEESDKWLAFLDADYDRQRAELDVLQSTGQLAKVFQ